MLFVDRADAGRHLAQRLRYLRGTGVVVLGVAGGGVPVAAEVAADLGAPLDVVVAAKLGVPFQPEYGFGAVGEDGVRVIDTQVVRQARLGGAEIAAVEAAARARLNRGVSQYRRNRPPLPLAGRTAVVVDDGLATGSTARAACAVARARGASRVVLAVPAGSAQAVAALRGDVDEAVCLHAPPRFAAVGEWYADFCELTDHDVTVLLDQAASRTTALDAGPEPAEIAVDLGGARLRGTLAIPDRAAGLVIFAHASASSRHSPRHQSAAAVLNRAGLGTLLADLLTTDEQLSRAYVGNVVMLGVRLAGMTGWLHSQPGTAAIPVGYFGVGPGAAAALWAAARPQLPVTAVVSQDGRPDLVGHRLALVQAPTLLIVGGADEALLRLNEQAQAQLGCENRMEIVRGASEFEEPGALDERVTDLASAWFTRRFTQAGELWHAA